MLFGFQPVFLPRAFGELGRDPGLQVGRQRAVPIQRGFGGVGQGAEFQILGQGPRNVATMKPGRVTRRGNIQRKLAVFNSVRGEKIVLHPR